MKNEVGHGLRVEGLANVRDLGGRERRDGSLTPDGVFFRAENLDRVTGRGWATLREAGVRTVLDLRRPDEVTDAVPDDLTVLRIDLDGDERDFWEEFERDGRWGTPLYYDAHLRELPHRLVHQRGSDECAARAVVRRGAAPRGARRPRTHRRLRVPRGLRPARCEGLVPARGPR